MIQIQSTWFPIIDRNPQNYVPNIFKAKDSDLMKCLKKLSNKNYLINSF